MSAFDTSTFFVSGIRRRFATGMIALVLAVCVTLSAFAQEIAIYRGQVKNKADKKPIPGVVVRVKEGKTGAFTDREGRFQISARRGDVLVFNILGYKKTEIRMGEKEVQLGSNQALEISMEEDILKLEEAVVTAVGIKQEKKAISYAVQEVKGEEIGRQQVTNVVNALVGQVAGVQINSSSGVPGASSNIRIRGVSSILGNNQPLFVVDGVPINNGGGSGGVASVDFSNRAIDLNPEDIESINVLKGPAATSLYGLQANAGAIVVTTKRGKNDSKTSVNFSYSLTLDQVNKLPGMQQRYAQGGGSAAAAGVLQTPESTSAASWGPAIDTLVFDNRVPYPWDPNGRLVGRSTFPGGAPARAYDPNQAFFQTGVSHLYNASVSGGSRDFSYVLSLSHNNSEGVVPLSSFQRNTVRVNVDYQAYNDLKVSASVQYNRTDARRIERGSNVNGVTLSLWRTPPTFDIAGGLTNPALNPASYIFPAGASWAGRTLTGLQRNYRGLNGTNPLYDNPFWVANQNPYTDNVERVLGNIQAVYTPEWFGKDLLGNLSVTYRLGGDFTNTNANQYFALGGASLGTLGRVYNGLAKDQILNSDLIISIDKQISEDLSYRLTIGNNLYQSTSRSLDVTGDGIVIPEFYHLSNVSGAPVVTQFDGRIKTGSVFGQLNLEYKNWLFFNGNMRSEWVSTLPKDANQFTTYGASLGVVLTEALGVRQEDAYVKLRGSFARTGAIPQLYLTQTQYNRAAFGDGWTTGITFPLAGSAGFTLGNRLGNNRLIPENRQEIEVGADIKLLEGRLNLDVTYYQSKNVDQIIPNVPIAGSSGYTSQVLNSGTMTNSGLEIVLNGNAYRDEDLSIDATINFSTFKNEVTSLAPGVSAIFLGGFTGGSIRAVTGVPYGSIFAVGWARDPQGNIIVDAAGRPLPGSEEKAWGANIPDFILGFRPTISWKGITLTALLDWKQGGVMWNGTRAALNFFGTSEESVNRENINGTYGGVTFVNNVAQGVQQTGPNTFVPNTTAIRVPGSTANASPGQAFWGNQGFYNNFNSGLGEPFVEDAGWVRLREISLSYNFRNVLPSDGIIKNLEVFATGRNLWLSTKYTGVDPETSLLGANNAQGLDYFNFPGVKSYIFGFRLGF
jgi:TonB-linked SusC/RagA family outer membrane protein